MAELRDTIVVIDKRDAQIRLLAGLPEPGLGRHARRAAAARCGSPDRARQYALRELRRRLDDPLPEQRAHVGHAVDHADHGMALESSSPAPASIRSCTSRGRTRASISPRPTARPWSRRRRARVMRISHQTGYGLVLEIEHGNGIETKYAHLSKVVVQEGQQVDPRPAHRRRRQQRPLDRPAPAL